METTYFDKIRYLWKLVFYVAGVPQDYAAGVPQDIEYKTECLLSMA